MDLPDKPADIADVFVEAWNARDAQRLASVFAEDAEFVNVVGLWWHDRPSIEKAHAYGFERIFPDSTLRLMRTSTKLLGDDVAVIHAKMHLTNQSGIDDVRAPAMRQNIFTFVMQRTAEGWQCVAAHNTDIVPGAETNVVDAEGKMRSASYR